MVQNYMEILVDEITKNVIKEYNVCKCKNCINDIKSIALNNLPPTYFLSNTEESEKKAFLINRQIRVSVLAQVAEAIKKVSKNNCNNIKNEG